MARMQPQYFDPNEEHMFETSFDDENMNMFQEQHQYSQSHSQLDWDTSHNHSFERSIISPTSLSATTTTRSLARARAKSRAKVAGNPRKASSLSGGNQNRDGHSHGNEYDYDYNYDPSPRMVTGEYESPSPTPFRNRFASAALVSQERNASTDSVSNRVEGAGEVVKNLFPTIQVYVSSSSSSSSSSSPSPSPSPSPLAEKSTGPLSPNDDHNAHGNARDNDESYESFGNQSVFSDITDMEMSASASVSAGGNSNSVSPSTSRDIRRKARESKKYPSSGNSHHGNSSSPMRQQMKKYVNARQDLYKVHEDNDNAESGHGQEKKISTRLASFFTSRSMIRPRSNNVDGTNNINNHNHNNRDKGDMNMIRRSLSVPQEQERQRKQEPEVSVSSEHSESSTSYVRWPGTLDRNGNTCYVEESEGESSSVQEELASASASAFVGPSQALSQRHSVHLQSRSNSNSRLNVDEVQKRIREAENVNLRTRNNLKLGNDNDNDHGRGDRGRNCTPPKATPTSTSILAAPTPVRSRVAELKRQFELKKAGNLAKDVVDLDVKPTGKISTSLPVHVATNIDDVVDLDVRPNDVDPKPSDYHLAAALATVRAHPIMSPPNASCDEGTSISSSDGSFASQEQEQRFNQRLPVESSPISARGPSQIDPSASLRRMQSAGKKITPLSRNKTQKYAFGFSSEDYSNGNMSGGLRLSEAALKQQDRFSSSIQNVAHGGNVRGYRGFIDKTADVPNLMDADLDSVTSASTMATNRSRQFGNDDDESDVFDGVSSNQSYRNNAERFGHKIESRQVEPNIVNITKNVSSIQTTAEAFESRKTSVEFDAALTESDTDYALSTNWRNKNVLSNSIVPRHYDSSGDVDSTDSESQGSFGEDPILPDLSSYVIESTQIRKLVKAFRNMSQFSTRTNTIQIEEEAKKCFALFEMRSRIMESDIERGFDRAGGTITVDDIVTTSYYKASCRVRDAVIVSKAWRDGASPQDARTALNLTRSNQYFVDRKRDYIYSGNISSSDNPKLTDGVNRHLQISRERVGWIDDTEFSIIRCFGSRTLRGFGIFTVGDCQSMLLKLTHEHFMALKQELNNASSRQLIAEQMMKHEGSHSSSMTDAELEYLSSMEDVKTLSKKLVDAERAFDMVKLEIENQVQKLEFILEQIDNESEDVDAYASDGSDFGDDESYTSAESEYDKVSLARRVQKAELKAEVAMREAQIAKVAAEQSKQEAETIRLEKEEKLGDLQAKLEDLEAKSSIMLSDFEAKLKSQTLLANSAASQNDNSFESIHQSMLYAASTVGTDPDQNETKERIKAKFRQRRTNSKQKDGHDDLGTEEKQKLSGKVHQRLEFYERSLRAIKV